MTAKKRINALCNWQTQYHAARFETTDDRLVIQIRKLVETFAQKQPKRVIAVAGPSGCGRLTFACHAWRLSRKRSLPVVIEADDLRVTQLERRIRCLTSEDLVIVRNLERSSPELVCFLGALSPDPTGPYILCTYSAPLPCPCPLNNFNHFEIQALRKRSADIWYLASTLAAKKSPLGFSPCARQSLTEYCWPGEYPELANCVCYCLWQARYEGRSIVEAEDVASFIDAEQPPNYWIYADLASSNFATLVEDKGLRGFMQEIEAFFIAAAMGKNQGNLSQAASALKLPVSTLSDRMRLLGSSLG